MQGASARRTRRATLLCARNRSGSTTRAPRRAGRRRARATMEAHPTRATLLCHEHDSRRRSGTCSYERCSQGRCAADFCCAVPLPVPSVPMWQPMTRLSMVGSDMCHISMVGSDMPHIDGWEWHTTRRWLEVTYHTAMVGRDMPRVDVSRVDRGWFGQVRLGCDTARLQAHPPVIPDRAILGLFITRSPRVTRVT